MFHCNAMKDKAVIRHILSTWGSLFMFQYITAMKDKGSRQRSVPKPQLSSNTIQAACRLGGLFWCLFYYYYIFYCNAIKGYKYTHVVFIIFDAMKGKGSRQRL